jgi:hypothetical protein
MSEFDEIRNFLDFDLDAKGEVWAVFIKEDDHRRFPLKSLVIQAQLDKFIKPEVKEKNARISMDALMYQCVRHATNKYRPKKDRDDDFLEEDGLVCAILNELARRKRLGQEPVLIGTVTKLLDSLLNLPEVERFDSEEWPKGSKFATYLRARTNVLRDLNVDLSYKRGGTARNYTLKFVGKRPDIKHVQVTDPDDLFETLGLYDPKPITGENPVTQGDAKGQLQASPPASTTKRTSERTGRSQESEGPHELNPEEKSQG